MGTIFAIPLSGSQVIDELLSLVCMHAILMGYQQQFIQYQARRYQAHTQALWLQTTAACVPRVPTIKPSFGVGFRSTYTQ
jgi:hypothetical protein